MKKFLLLLTLATVSSVPFTTIYGQAHPKVENYITNNPPVYFNSPAEFTISGEKISVDISSPNLSYKDKGLTYQWAFALNLSSAPKEPFQGYWTVQDNLEVNAQAQIGNELITFRESFEKASLLSTQTVVSKAQTPNGRSFSIKIIVEKRDIGVKVVKPASYNSMEMDVAMSLPGYIVTVKDLEDTTQGTAPTPVTPPAISAQVDSAAYLETHRPIYFYSSPIVDVISVAGNITQQPVVHISSPDLENQGQPLSYEPRLTIPLWGGVGAPSKPSEDFQGYLRKDSLTIDVTVGLTQKVDFSTTFDNVLALSGTQLKTDEQTVKGRTFSMEISIEKKADISVVVSDLASGVPTKVTKTIGGYIVSVQSIKEIEQGTVSTPTPTPNLAYDYYNDHPIVYATISNVGYDGKLERPVVSLTEKTVDDCSRIKYNKKSPEPSSDCLGFLKNKDSMALAVQVGNLEFSGTLDIGSIATGEKETTEIRQDVNNKRYALKIYIEKKEVDVNIPITNVNVVNTVPYYLITFGKNVEEPATIGGDKVPTMPPPMMVYTKEYFDVYPLIYVSKKLTTMSYKGESAVAKVSVSDLKKEELPWTGASVAGGNDFEYRGTLSSKSSARVIVKVGNLEFSKNLTELAAGDSQVIITASNGKEYKSIINVEEKKVNIVLNPNEGSKPTAVTAYKISLGPITEVETKDKPEEGGVPVADALGKQVIERGYVIADPQLAFNGEGYNFGGRIVKVAVSPFARNQAITNPESAVAIKDRIGGSYEGYAPLGFPQGRELVVMVDDKIEGRRIGFTTHTVGIDLIVNGRQKKLFVRITPVKVPFVINEGLGVTADVTMYVITIGQ